MICVFKFNRVKLTRESKVYNDKKKDNLDFRLSVKKKYIFCAFFERMKSCILKCETKSCFINLNVFVYK